MITVNIEAIKVNDFSAGFGTKVSALGYPPNMSPSCLNVVPKVLKGLSKRNGYVLIAAGIPDTYSLLEWKVSDSVNRIIATSGTALKYMDNLSGSWTTALGADLNSGAYYDFTFTSYGDSVYLLMTSSERDNLLQMNSSGLLAAVSDSPFGKYIIEWENYIFIGNLSDGSSDMKYSAIGNYTSWPSDNREYLSTKFGDQVRGFAVLKRRLYVFKDWSIHRYSFLGGTPTFQKDSLLGIGTISYKTIQEIDIADMGKFLIFLGTDGRVYIFDGYNPPQDVSDIITYDNRSKVNLGKLNRTYMNKAVGINYRDLKWYVLFYPQTDSNTVGLIFDYSRKPLSIWPIDNHFVQAIAECTNSLSIKKPFFVDPNGNLFEFDKGNTDNVTAINSYWRSPRYEIGSSQILKQGYQLSLPVKTVGRNSLTFKYRENWNDAWITCDNIYQASNNIDLLGETFVLGQSKLGGEEVFENIIDIPSLSNLIQFEISDNSTNRPWTVYKLEQIIEKIGIGG